MNKGNIKREEAIERNIAQLENPSARIPKKSRLHTYTFFSLATFANYATKFKMKLQKTG